jgi:capsular exopolysaccharide synthesis family protein
LSSEESARLAASQTPIRAPVWQDDDRTYRDEDEGSTLREYVRIAKRRGWIVAATTLVTAGVAVLLTLQQQPAYSAHAELLLTRQNLVTPLTGAQDPSIYVESDRLLQTLAEFARLPAVAHRAVARARIPGMTAEQLLASSSVTPKLDADVLDFVVTTDDPRVAQRLASVYAAQFGRYRRNLDTASLRRARAKLELQIEELANTGDRSSALYADLLSKAQQLQTLEALQPANTYVVHAADSATQVRPRPARNGMIAAAIGLLLGIAVAFAAERLSRRVASNADIRRRLQLPILAYIPNPPRKLKSNELVMIVDPRNAHAESFRMLRTNLELIGLGWETRTVMFTSARRGDGKSTSIANLAFALSHAGREVAIVDLDQRNPSQHRLLGVRPVPGLTDVAVGHVQLEDALSEVSMRDLVRPGDSATNGRVTVKGVVHALLAGQAIPDDGLITSEAVTAILHDLRTRFEVVLVDAPPLLSSADAVALSATVDGVIVVVRRDTIRASVLDELKQVLTVARANTLGAVITAADVTESGYYGESRYSERPREDSVPRSARWAPQK